MKAPATTLAGVVKGCTVAWALCTYKAPYQRLLCLPAIDFALILMAQTLNVLAVHESDWLYTIIPRADDFGCSSCTSVLIIQFK